MNYISKAERMKQYYKGLEKASEYHLPDEVLAEVLADQENPELEPIFRESQVLIMNVVAPLHRVLSFINNNRMIHEWWQEILDEAKEQETSLSPEEIYHTLLSLEPYSAKEFIGTIDADSATLNQLQDSYARNDKEAFVTLLHNKPCGLRAISALCSLVWPDTTSVFSLPPEELFTAMDALATTNTNDVNKEGQMMLRSIENMSQIGTQLLNQEYGNEYEYNADVKAYYRAQYKFACNALSVLGSEYTDDVTAYKPRERKIIEAILSRPEAQVQMRTVEMDGDDFSLPPDYFSLKNESANSDDCFNLRYEVVKNGAERFAELINALAAHGYIDNNNQVKQMFAYRFSSKMRPERIVPIEWKGRNGRSYELIYLIRCLTERGSYRKMRQFFFGPQWTKDRDSSYAKSAAYEFKLLLHQLYPTLPDMI